MLAILASRGDSSTPHLLSKAAFSFPALGSRVGNPRSHTQVLQSSVHRRNSDQPSRTALHVTLYTSPAPPPDPSEGGRRGVSQCISDHPQRWVCQRRVPMSPNRLARVPLHSALHQTLCPCHVTVTSPSPSRMQLRTHDGETLVFSREGTLVVVRICMLKISRC